MTTANGGDGRGPREKTVLRPQPGGRAGVRPTPGGSVAPPAGRPTGNPATGAAEAGGPVPGAARSASEWGGRGNTGSVEDFIAHGGNPLLAAAGPLLILGATVGSTVQQTDVEGLRRRAIESVQAFEAQALAGGIEPGDVTIGRYIVCTFLDSAIFQTPWGGQTVWGARSLLLTFHKEAHGGEKFFTILERLRQDPARYTNLLELQYVCLALGFTGKYRLETHGRAVVQAIQDDLYRVIRARRSSDGTTLSAHWEGVAAPTSRASRLIPWWVAALVGVTVVLAVLILLRSNLSEQAAPIEAALAVRGIESGYVAPAPSPVPQAPSRLKELLAPQEQSGQLSVEEFGKRTVVTLKVPELFPSGSAQVTPQYVPLFAAIGRAIEAVPGRVAVVGHTDDQPVRSFRFADNFELSRARAVAVAQLLKPELSDFSRIESSGAGATQPRYEPVSSPENRMRNRRVEVVHMAE